jgi:FkbM family methyltransferase
MDPYRRFRLKHSSDAREPLDVRVLRRLLRDWPFKRGKGAIMRVARPFLDRRDFVMQVEPGIIAMPDLDDRILHWCFVDGSESWDPVMHLSRAIIRPGDTLLDVGANVGLWVLGAARRAGGKARVVAFEPVPGILLRLRRNLALNGLSSVVCEQLALSDRAGSGRFFAATGSNSGMGSLAAHDGADHAIDAQITTLDSYCDAVGIDCISVVKVDVEGAERLVFEGGRHRLARDDGPAIMFEVNEGLAALFGNSTVSVKQLLAECGYRIFRFDGRALYEVRMEEHHGGEDLMAFKPMHFARLALPPIAH